MTDEECASMIESMTKRKERMRLLNKKRAKVEREFLPIRLALLRDPGFRKQMLKERAYYDW